MLNYMFLYNFFGLTLSDTFPIVVNGFIFSYIHFLSFRNVKGVKKRSLSPPWKNLSEILSYEK